MESFESFENDQNNQLEEILLNTQEQCQMVEHLIKNQIEVKDQMIEKLHKELEFYKQDYADKFTDQLMKAVIRVQKSMQRCMTAGDWETLDASRLRREYRYAFEDLTDLLEQQNVDAYSTEPGNVFDAAIHQAKLEKTTDPQKDKLVKESLGEGYRKNGKVLIPEKVIVYQYTENGGDSL